MTRPMALVALASFVACGPNRGPTPPIESSVSAVVHEEATAAPPRKPSPSPPPAVPEPKVVLGRISDREAGEGACKRDDDCVVVDRLRQRELCPPGVAVSRELSTLEERWRQRGFGYRPNGAPCPAVGQEARAGCSAERCTIYRSSTSETATLDEQVIAATLPALEQCFAEAERPAGPTIAGLTASMVVHQSGAVEAILFEPKDAWPGFERCAHRTLIRLMFPLPQTQRLLTVPFTFR